MLSNDLPLDSEGFIDLDQIDDLPDPNLGPPPLLGFDHLYDLGWFDQLIDGTTGPARTMRAISVERTGARMVGGKDRSPAASREGDGR